MDESPAEQPTVKEISWELHLGDCGNPGQGQFAVIEPQMHEYPPDKAPAYLRPPEACARPPGAGGAAAWPLPLLPWLVLAAAAVLALAARSWLRARRRKPPPEKGDPSEVVVLCDFPRRARQLALGELSPVHACGQASGAWWRYN